VRRKEFNTNRIPVGYLLTFRCYGTWLHGDIRGSTDRFHRTFGTPKLAPSSRRVMVERLLLKQLPVYLDKRRRSAIESAIRETCITRKWSLWAFNIRTNHVHTVVTAPRKPESVLSALKANATKAMRAKGCWESDLSPWAHRGSRKYLWTEQDLVEAIAYVTDDQGEPLP